MEVPLLSLSYQEKAITNLTMAYCLRAIVASMEAILARAREACHRRRARINRPRRKNQSRPRRGGAGATADFVAAADFFPGAPRRSTRARPPTVRGESLESESSYVLR